MTDTHQYAVGDLTFKRVFQSGKLTDMSDMQAVLDAVEAALAAPHEHGPGTNQAGKVDLLRQAANLVYRIEAAGMVEYEGTNFERWKADARALAPDLRAALAAQPGTTQDGTENIDPGTPRYEAARALLVADLLRIDAKAYGKMADALKAGELMFLPSWVAMQAIARLLSSTIVESPSHPDAEGASDEDVARLIDPYAWDEDDGSHGAFMAQQISLTKAAAIRLALNLEKARADPR